MAALFPRWSNTALKLTLISGALLAIAAVGGPMLYVRTPYNTGQLQPVDQPVMFDHRHHVVDAKIECVYCHRGVETSPFAGIPETEVCMGCHSQIWNDSPLLEPVRRSYFSNQPIRWNRVNQVPDFVYFDHSVHVRDGIDCVSCHGHVEAMAKVYQAAPLTMGFCLDCHRDPPPHGTTRTVATRDQTTFGATVSNLTPTIPKGDRSITSLTTCTACHR